MSCSPRCSSRPGRWSERTRSQLISRPGHGEPAASFCHGYGRNTQCFKLRGRQPNVVFQSNCLSRRLKNVGSNFPCVQIHAGRVRSRGWQPGRSRTPVSSQQHKTSRVGQGPSNDRFIASTPAILQDKPIVRSTEGLPPPDTGAYPDPSGSEQLTGTSPATPIVARQVTVL